MKLEKFTIGMGDRFGHQGIAQLKAVMEANQRNLPVFPVWNKSNREHKIVGTEPLSLRAEADHAVQRLGWKGSYYVDADHIQFDTVAPFVPGSNFFTLDVAEQVGSPPDADALRRFDAAVSPYKGNLRIPGIDQPFVVDDAVLESTAANFLAASVRAGEIYRFLAEAKQSESFVTEVSMDETDRPQSPVELFLILVMLSMEGVPVQTLAPKFTGRFNKGVEYVGDLRQFEREFDEDLHVIRFAVQKLGLPENLKLSIHSGSDKFSLYPVMNRLIRQHGCGLHVKTAGTTWLEELIGLAQAGGNGFQIAKKIYGDAFDRFVEM